MSENEDQNSVIASMPPPLDNDYSLSQADLDAIDVGLNNALAELDVAKIELAPDRVEPAARVDTAERSPSTQVETGVISDRSETGVTRTEPEEVPEVTEKTPIGLSVKGRADWDKLRKEKKEWKKIAVEREKVAAAWYAKALELESALTQAPTTQIPAEVVAELNSLREFRDIFGVENFSDMAKQYDAKILENQSKVAKVLVGNGMLATIAEARAFAKENNSDSVPISAEALVNHGLEKVDAQYWDTQVFPKISSLDRRQIEDGILATLALKQEKAERVKQVAANREQYLRNAEIQRQQALEKEKAVVYSELDKYYKIAPWAKKMTLTGRETPDQKAAIEAHNKTCDWYEEIFIAAYTPRSVEARVETAASAVLVQRQDMEIQALRKALDLAREEIAARDKKLSGIKTRSNTQSSTVTPQTTAPRTTPTTDRMKLSASEAFDLAMKEFEAA